jgi:tetratricopeptide (TPR) repeat protein
MELFCTSYFILGILIQGDYAANHCIPGSYPNPETSSSAFFCYALAYGIHAGLLDREVYLPRVTKAWEALVSAVFPNGKLGWVQPIGEYPNSANTYDSLGEAYLVRGDLDKALRNYKKSLKLGPESANARKMIEGIDRRMGQ